MPLFDQLASIGSAGARVSANGASSSSPAAARANARPLRVPNGDVVAARTQEYQL